MRGECIKVIDTPEFQRLRDVKQLGTSYFVFPGACHNRFEHSLGVCHLAEEMVLRLKRAQPELEITNNEVKQVAIAGLCHDLGHAPFSHVFDNEFLPAMLDSEEQIKSFGTHEKMSIRLLDQIRDKEYVDDDILSSEDVRHIEDLICASCSDHHATHFKGRSFLTEIVANGRNSIDVDKFDYLERDCFYCGVKASCDFRRVMPFLKVIDDTICFKASEVHNIYDIFHTRASLHRRVYTHKVNKAIEYMVVDALIEANQHFDILNKARDPEHFIELDDSILKRIEYANPSGDDAGLRKAKEIVTRLRRRNIYKYVNEYCIPKDMLRNYRKVTAADVAGCQEVGKANGVQLRPEDLIVHNMKIDFCMKEKNPVDKVFFFQGLESTEKFTIQKEKVSSLLPDVFQERSVRLFVKDPKKLEAASIAFEAYQKREFGSPQQVSTPTINRNKGGPVSPYCETKLKVSFNPPKMGNPKRPLFAFKGSDARREQPKRSRP